LNDKRFENIFTDSNYAVDPTHPLFIMRQTDAMKSIQKERLRRRFGEANGNEEVPMESNTKQSEGSRSQKLNEDRNDLKSLAATIRKKSKERGNK
jgi:hypothetical protein